MFSFSIDRCNAKIEDSEGIDYSVSTLANLRHNLSAGITFVINLKNESDDSIKCKCDLEFFKKIVDGEFMEAELNEN